jgi:hypothetical protein
MKQLDELEQNSADAQSKQQHVAWPSLPAHPGVGFLCSVWMNSHIEQDLHSLYVCMYVHALTSTHIQHI